MIISLSGMPGAGKSTVGKKLAEKIDWPFYSVGRIRRQKAKEKGMTIEEYNKLGEEDPSTDYEVDEYQEKLGKQEDNFVIDSRIAWHFIPRSFKVYLDVDWEEGAKRIKEELKEKGERNEGGIKTLEETKEDLKKRMESDIKRYEKYYGLDVFNKGHYDLIIDTTDITAEEAAKKIHKKIQNLENACQ